MKKHILKLFSLFVCVIFSSVSLTGCNAADRVLGLVRDGIYRSNVPDFSDMGYTRPDLEAFENTVEELKLSLEYGDDFDSISSLVDECYAHYYNFDTMYTLANIRYCHDNSDEYYAEEYFWCEENSPLVQQLMDDMYYACGGSDISVELENEVFWDGFAEEYADAENSVYTDRLISLMQQESGLLAEYRELCTAPVIEYQDESCDYNELLSDPYISYDEHREIVGSYYEQYNSEFSRIFTGLIKTRRAIASELGYESYEQMQYDYSYERDYSPQQALSYTQDIKRYMAPLYKSLNDQGIYDYIIYDEVSEDMLISAVGAAARGMDESIDDAFSFMTGHELCDVSVSPLKSPMSFEVYINDYEVPYVFMDAVGDSYDLLTFSHEFGHYLDGFINYNAYETLDLSEAFSQAMEYLMLFYYEDYPDAEGVEMLTAIKMLDTLDMYLNQACYAEFESLLYSAPEELLSAEYINSLFLGLCEEYGLCEEGDIFSAMSWCDIVHFFEMPFYVISYPVSNDAAMQIYELELNKSGAGLDKYLEMLPREYPGIIDTLEAAGLESPFAPGRIAKVTADLSEILVLKKAAA